MVFSEGSLYISLTRVIKTTVMKKSYLFALALMTFLMVGITPGVQAQLTAGDLAIIYYRSDAVDTVTVITLVPFI
jgi:hypothetical protein